MACYRYVAPAGSFTRLRQGKFITSCFKSAGDCRDFAQSAEQKGAVPFAEADFETA